MGIAHYRLENTYDYVRDFVKYLQEIDGDLSLLSEEDKMYAELLFKKCQEIVNLYV